jgi:iron complex outermembrane receptor protein
VQKYIGVFPSQYGKFGYLLNYTFAWSRTPNTDELTGENLPMPFMSKDSGNFTLFWENTVTSLRLAYNYRGAYLEVQQAALSGGSIFMRARSQLDLFGSVKLAERAKLTFEIQNMTRSLSSSYVGLPERLYNAWQDDRRLYVGLYVTY